MGNRLDSQLGTTVDTFARRWKNVRNGKSFGFTVGDNCVHICQTVVGSVGLGWTGCVFGVLRASDKPGLFWGQAETACFTLAGRDCLWDNGSGLGDVAGTGNVGSGSL